MLCNVKLYCMNFHTLLTNFINWSLNYNSWKRIFEISFLYSIHNLARNLLVDNNLHIIVWMIPMTLGYKMSFDSWPSISCLFIEMLFFYLLDTMSQTFNNMTIFLESFRQNCENFVRQSETGKYINVIIFSVKPFDRYHQLEISRSGTNFNKVNMSWRHIKNMNTIDIKNYQWRYDWQGCFSKAIPRNSMEKQGDDLESNENFAHISFSGNCLFSIRINKISV